MAAVVDHLLQEEISRALHRHQRGWALDALDPLETGRSATTVAAELRGPAGERRRVVVRASRAGRPGLSLATASEQFGVLERLHGDGLPVPQPVLAWDGADASHYDLLITAFVAGEVPDPWRSSGRARIAELRRDERFLDEFVETMAWVHAVGLSGLPSSLQARPEVGYLARCLDRARTALAPTAFAEDPVLTYLECLLRRADDGPGRDTGVVHGDFRLGNLVIRDQRLVAVLDWELVEWGEPLSDLAWLCGPQGSVDGYPGGLFADELDAISRYEKASGQPVDRERFRLLTMAGTFRTAGVWTQLSEDEAHDGRLAHAQRRRDSVIEMIGLCGRVANLARPPDPVLDPASPGLLDAVAGQAREAGGELDRYLAESGQRLTPEWYSARLLLRRVAALSDGRFARFSDEVATLGQAVGCPRTSAQPPGPGLSHLVREHSLDDDRVRAAVAHSAAPDIAFLNFALARREES